MTSTSTTNLPPEARLLLRLARTTIDEGPIPETLDWDHFVQLALRLKVVPLVYRQLETRSINTDVIERIRGLYYSNALRNDSLTDALCDVLRLLGDHGIRAIPFKGPILAASVYGDLGLRQFSDLDILIEKRDARKCAELLQTIGYRSEHGLSAEQRDSLLAIECEEMFIRDDGPTYLDLHWNFAPRYFGLPLDANGIRSRALSVTLKDTPTLTFAPEDLVLTLCVNAAKEFWERLSLVCDIAEAIRANPSLDWNRVAREASASGTGRILRVSLLLANDLLDATSPLLNNARADERAVVLARDIAQGLFAIASQLGSVSSFLRPVAALDSFGARLRFRLRLALTPTHEDWKSVRFPRALSFMYYLTRPMRLAKKYVLKG